MHIYITLTDLVTFGNSHQTLVCKQYIVLDPKVAVVKNEDK